MKTDSQIISTLNAVLTVELTSINRYFLHARMYKNWGFENLNHVSYKKSIKDMKQSDKLIERILFLEGLPNLQKLEPLQIGENSEEMLNCDLGFQQNNIAVLKNAIHTCEQAKDYVSRSLLADILEYEEEYFDWVEAQQHQIAEMGLQNYLQAQISEGD